MNFARINFSDISNGPGVRLSLFVSGCSHRCSGCFNQAAMKYDAGQLFTDKQKQQIIDGLSDPYISGLSILGGEPLDPVNRDVVADLCNTVKSIYPNKTIWLWTGYELSDVYKCEALKYVDIVVDGPYIKGLPRLQWRGSSNQMVWHRSIDGFVCCPEDCVDSLE